ncbi:HNH endonuclease signature motif containing protein [Actinotalea sp. JY-7876]|uniref:HNH endonuclease signature motif containing protein n=1 Tax=Actinotalea sp. JY-7876 TaxID=2758442 RepID=UPI0015F3DF65|nr:HNH endonuclease signature motif containing protein [Actinotalea sp. JY-7876]
MSTSLSDPVGAGPVPEDGGGGAGTWAEAWLWSMRHRLAAELEEAVPGPELAARLGGLEPADMDDAALIEAVAAWERLASWVAAGQARAIAQLASRPRALGGAFVADQVAACLSTTGAVAENKVALALAAERVPAVGDALARGEIDVRRATVLTDELRRLPDAAAQDVALSVLPGARTCTAPQLRSRLRRMELLRDPDGAAARHADARGQRRVELQPVADSMAWLAAYLPADDALAVHTTLTALAGEAAPDDSRSLDERRADALVDVATRWLDAGAHPDGTPLATRQGRRPHLAVTASAATLLGLSHEPADLQGYGPIPPDMARRIASRATWEPLLVAVRSGEPLARGTRTYAPTRSLRDAVGLRDRTCRFPGCRMPAARCDIDHVTPFDPVPGVDEPSVDEPGVEQTRVGNLQALCRHHHRAKTHGGWSPTRREDGVTVWRSPTGQTYRRLPEHEPPMNPPRPPPPDGVIIDLHPPPF